MFVSLRKLEAKVAEIYNSCNETKSMQIKADKKSIILKKIERRKKRQ